MDDAELLQIAADRIALVTRTRLSDLDRAAASALQRSLMPGALPRVTGIEFAARYIPGEAGGLGGDWYDVFSLPSGRLGVVIGDVVGRGLQAAVIMGRLRSALRAFALEEDDPAEVLERLDGNVQHFEENVMATVLYAIFEPSLERVSLSSAGHLPPIIAQPGERSALLNVPIDLPVGVSVGPPRRTTIDRPPGPRRCSSSTPTVSSNGAGARWTPAWTRCARWCGPRRPSRCAAGCCTA